MAVFEILQSRLGQLEDAEIALAAAEQRAADAEAETVRWYDKHVAHMAALGDQGRQLRMALARAEDAEAALSQAREELAALRRVAEAGQAFLAQLHTGLPLNMATPDLLGYIDFAHALDVAGMAALDAAGEVGDGV